MARTLVFIRHGERDQDSDEPDNGLNTRGLAQARALRWFYDLRFGHAPSRLMSSPRRRCRETLAPIADHCDREVEVEPLLDERRANESSATFNARVRAYLDQRAIAVDQLVIACSHGDWLPRAITDVMGRAPEFGNACWFEIRWRDGTAELSWFVPTFAPFLSRS